jgi:hypothetical protein
MSTYISPDAMPFPSPGHTATMPPAPSVTLPDSPHGPYDPRTGMPFLNLDAWRAAEEEFERRLHAHWIEHAEGIREAIAVASANLEQLKLAAAEAEAAMNALGPFNTKAAEGAWLEGTAGQRHQVRRRWADAVQSVETQQAALINLQRDLKTRRWAYTRPEPVWRPA